VGFIPTYVKFELRKGPVTEPICNSKTACVVHIYKITQVCTNPGSQIAMATKFCAVAPYMCGSSVWNVLHVTRLASRNLRWLLRFLEHFCIPTLMGSFTVKADCYLTEF
jgi:hypothetical protein